MKHTPPLALLIGGCAFAVIFPVPSTQAEETSSLQNRATLPTITIYAPKRSLTVPDVVSQRVILDRNAGSVAFVDSEDYKTRYAHTLRDVLQNTPGVFVQNRYGQEMRVSVRGSGMSRGYHARGLEILQDGIPTNFADGSGDYYHRSIRSPCAPSKSIRAVTDLPMVHRPWAARSIS